MGGSINGGTFASMFGIQCFFQVKMWGFLNSVDIAIQRLEDAQEAPGVDEPAAASGFGWTLGDVPKKMGGSSISAKKLVNQQQTYVKFTRFQPKIGKTPAKVRENHMC